MPEVTLHAAAELGKDRILAACNCATGRQREYDEC